MRTDRTVLVTGGTGGIGLATAELFASDGDRVYVTGRSEAGLRDARAKGLIDIQADMSDMGDLRSIVERLDADLQRLDVLVVNAAAADITPFGRTDTATFDKIFDLNVRSTFFTVQSLLSQMADGASIILIGSIYSLTGTRGFSVYNASKAAVRSFARTWANELQNRRIRVNVVSPGPVPTAMTLRLLGDDQAALDAAKDQAAAQTPAGRIGTPEDIARAVRFLAGSDATYINGVELCVDGGRSQV